MSYFEIKGPMPPMITPFTADGKVDFLAFAQNIEKWNEYALTGYLVLGSNGESAYLSEEDKLELVRLTAKYASPGKLIMAGTGVESTSATVRLTNQAADLGAKCALLLTPAYYFDQMDDQAQLRYFTQVADQTNIPILIYNVTKYTHINISPAVVSELSHHPNIIGMKDSSGNTSQLMSFITKGLDPQFNLMVGTASAWYTAMTIGIRAGIMALANCCPQQCVDMYNLFCEGKYKESLELYTRMFPVNACVTGKLGVPALKYACTRLGFHGGYCCPPLSPTLSQEQQKQVEAILHKAELV